MSGRVLIIPAAGAGSRLGASLPKALVPVAGVPMVERLLTLYENYVDEAIIVASPEARDAIEAAVHQRARVAVQQQPTGMLDAIMAAAPDVPSAATSIWITWCDQVLIRRATLAALAAAIDGSPEAALVMPTVHRVDPYIHLERDAVGRIIRVLHRRESDAMPHEGESDMGLFALTGEAFRVLVPRFARETLPSGVTRERNFLPFIPWVAEHGTVVTFTCTDPMEALGVNTPAELALAERYLEDRG